MSVSRIQNALEKAFGVQRLVFWYDPTAGWAKEFASLTLPGVEKLRVENTEFGTKHHITSVAQRQRSIYGVIT